MDTPTAAAAHCKELVHCACKMSCSEGCECENPLCVCDGPFRLSSISENVCISDCYHGAKLHVCITLLCVHENHFSFNSQKLNFATLNVFMVMQIKLVVSAIMLFFIITSLGKCYFLQVAILLNLHACESLLLVIRWFTFKLHVVVLFTN